MVRPVLSCMLALLILVSQVGVPMHLHYCRGTLEAVSLLFKPGCRSHQEERKQASCCRKMATSHCQKGKDDCCRDQITLLHQPVVSIAAGITKWDPVQTEEIKILPVTQASYQPVEVQALALPARDTGPPLFILHQSLIYYA